MWSPLHIVPGGCLLLPADIVITSEPSPPGVLVVKRKECRPVSTQEYRKVQQYSPSRLQKHKMKSSLLDGKVEGLAKPK